MEFRILEALGIETILTILYVVTSRKKLVVFLILYVLVPALATRLGDPFVFVIVGIA